MNNNLQEKVRKCFFFHDWENWKIINETRGDIRGWPIVIIEQNRKCHTCNYTEVNLQKRDSSKVVNIND